MSFVRSPIIIKMEDYLLQIESEYYTVEEASLPTNHFPLP